MKLDKAKRAELKALAEKATPGPYIPDNSLIHTARQREFMSADFPNHTDNAKFAAGAMTALPDALADIEELESKLADAVKALERVRGEILTESASDIVRHIDAALSKLE